MDEFENLHNAIRDLTVACQTLLPALTRINQSDEQGKPLTPQQAADFLSVPLATFRHWQTIKKIHPMTGLSAKHPRYERDYLLKILKDGFVDAQISDTREKLNKKRVRITK
jgi:hypothetical protein